MVEIGNMVVGIKDGLIEFDNGFTMKAPKVKPKKENTVEVFAFTGMKLGDLEIAKDTKTQLTVVKSDGKEIVFDKKTGLQKNCKNARYANRINV